MKIVLIIFSAFILKSCSSRVTTANSETSSQIPEKFIEMTAVNHATCKFLLQDSNKNTFEVQDITAKLPQLKTGKKIWVTYQPLRRMSACGAQPIEITEIYSEK